MEFSIGEFSAATGVSVHTLRYYEKEHLITAKRRENGRRYYSDKDISWMSFIKRLKDTNMPIKEIQKYALLRAAGDSTLQERMELLIKHREILAQEITFMQKNFDNLNDKISFYQNEIKVKNKR